MKNTQSFSNCHLKLLDFDYNYYVNKYPDLLKAGINNPKVAAWHYLNYGIEEGRFKNQTDKIEKTYQLRLKTEEEKKIYKKNFIMLISCEKNKERIKIIKSLWLDYCKIPYKIIVGNPDLSTDYEEKDDYLIIKTCDSYVNLPSKVSLAIKYLNILYDFDSIIKIDDDVIVNLDKFYSYLQTEKYNYEGYFIEELGTNCGGPIYFLSKKSIDILSEDFEIPNMFEDQCVSYNLKKKNIYPQLKVLYYTLHPDSVFPAQRNNDVPISSFNLNNVISYHCNDLIKNIKKNVYIELCGGLGNRLFQVAFLYILNKMPWINCYYFEREKNNHNTSQLWCHEILSSLNIQNRYPQNNRIFINESHSNEYDIDIFQKIIKSTEKNVIINKYFQSHKYFENYKSDINDLIDKFLFKNQVNFTKNMDNKVFIHIRGPG